MGFRCGAVRLRVDLRSGEADRVPGGEDLCGDGDGDRLIFFAAGVFLLRFVRDSLGCLFVDRC